jgi:hypothetical protein
MDLTPQVNERLRSAVRGLTAPAYLETRIRAQIRSADRKRPWALYLAPVAAALAITFGSAAAYQLGYLRYTAASQNAYVFKVTNQVATLMRVGLDNHLRCAVFRDYPANPPTMGRFLANLGAKYAGLIPIVQKNVPAGYQLVLAHQCTWHKRKFVHLVTKKGSRLMSLVVTLKKEGESYNTEGLLPALVQSDLPIYHGAVQRFQIDSFESRDYLVYFVSDSSKEQNMEVMRAMASSVKALLAKLEA